MPFLYVNNKSVHCKGILFDKDGTLLDFMAMWGAWAEIVLGGMEDTLTQIGTGFCGNAAKLLGTEHDAGGRVTGYDPGGPLPMATVEETNGILAWQLYAAGVPWNEALTRVTAISKEAMNEVRRRRTATPLPGLLPFLHQCAGASLKLGVVTSDESATTAEHLDWLGIAGFFDTVVTRDRVSMGKPAPEMAQLACRELGLAPDETIIIGDSNGDMQMGKAAGLCLTVGIAGRDGFREHLLDADTVIADFSGLVITP
ncbi:HAD family hydrolase [Paenibacillus sp. BR2-3]|uniref:HAD family hydrolase n=1 Tax=Paenibacillus sp. BR2-3 TaxID=3048494 RepID=UPI00397763FC